MPEGAQFAYGGFYDQVTGYYYEYPVMLVGPPVPGHPNPNVLAAMSCGPVPLRPVEWFNPQYMPESLQEQHPPPHSTDSQAITRYNIFSGERKKTLFNISTY